MKRPEASPDCEGGNLESGVFCAWSGQNDQNILMPTRYKLCLERMEASADGEGGDLELEEGGVRAVDASVRGHVQHGLPPGHRAAILGLSERSGGGSTLSGFLRTPGAMLSM